MGYYSGIVDESTFQQLKDSEHRHPEITEVIFDSAKMLEMGLIAINNAKYGFDIVWDKIMFNFLWLNFREGIYLAERQAEEKGTRLRLIVEVIKENVNFISSIKYHEIRHIDNIRSNFAILDNRAYMVQIFHKENEPPAQALFSNSKTLVENQQALFDRLWEIATPLAFRIKEIEYQDSLNYPKILTDYTEIHKEISSLIVQSKKELFIFSSFKILQNTIIYNNHFKQFLVLSKRGVTIKLLTDDINEHLLNQITEINRANKDEQIKLGYSNKLGNFNEMVIIVDSKYVLQVKYDQENSLVASFSNEEHNILVQEILFEKYWNEVESLSAVTNS